MKHHFFLGRREERSRVFSLVFRATEGLKNMYLEKITESLMDEVVCSGGTGEGFHFRQGFGLQSLNRIYIYTVKLYLNINGEPSGQDYPNPAAYCY